MSFDSSADANKYTIQYADAVSFVTGRSHVGDQVILGVRGTFVAAVFFDTRGNFLRCETRESTVTGNQTIQKASKPVGTHLDQLWALLEEWKSQIGFMPSSIVVTKFFLPDLRLGISELPTYLQDILDDPDSIADADYRRELLGEIAEWRARKKFVLHWGNEYWMDSAGEVTDT